jgi:hypothetical protein
MFHLPTRKQILSLAAIGVLALGSVLSNAAPGAAAGGQTGAIRGTVVDANNTAVPGADVMLNGPNGRYTAHTDGRGKFSLIGVLSDTYTLTVRTGGALKISQPGVGIVGDDTVDLGTIKLPAS